MPKKNENDVLKIISKILKINIKKINKSVKFSKIEGWDSLNHLNILIELDKTFKNKISSIPKFGEVSSINQMLKILRSNNLIL
tara:strand:+ start:264 stop:512 length:249 start_codon:yes stop_codon:yes gene_type:complete